MKKWQHYPNDKLARLARLVRLVSLVSLVRLFRTGVLNLLVLAYPRIMLNPLRIPLNKKLTQIVPPNEKMGNFRDKKTRMGSLPIDLKLLPSYNLLVYPLWTWGIPLRVRVPQVENRWFRPIKIVQLEIWSLCESRLKWVELKKVKLLTVSSLCLSS